MEPCFVFSLYRGLSVYTTFMNDKISTLKEKYSNATFVIVSDVETATECIPYVPYVGDCVEWRIYEMHKRSANRGLASFLRFDVVFDEKYMEKTVIILDVHDDVSEQIRCIDKQFSNLIRQKKEMFFMYVQSDDLDCPYNCSVHKTIHTHRDAGFSVWVPGTIRRENVTTYREFWVNLQSYYNEYGYGAEEVLIDFFLSYAVVDLHKKQILCRNKFLACGNCKGPIPTETFSVDKKILDDASSLAGRISFKGNRDMYICSRLEF